MFVHRLGGLLSSGVLAFVFLWSEKALALAVEVYILLSTIAQLVLPPVDPLFQSSALPPTPSPPTLVGKRHQHRVALSPVIQSQRARGGPRDPRCGKPCPALHPPHVVVVLL